MTTTTMEHDYLSQDDVLQLLPGMTKGALAQLRYTGKGPKFLKPTPRTVLYRRQDVIDWLEASEQNITSSPSA